MNRRGFLGLIGAAVSGIALDKAIPFNRVWSFPSQIIVPGNELLTTEMITREALAILQANLRFDEIITRRYDPYFDRQPNPVIFA